MGIRTLATVIVIACVASCSRFAGAKKAVLDIIDYDKNNRLRRRNSLSLGKTDAYNEERIPDAPTVIPIIRNVNGSRSSMWSALFLAYLAILAILVAVAGCAAFST
ncbi:uncharacterized protein CCR75_002729 [Bremia lactucae]|uniref:RxLR effector protein n=1 Tax=Bremia lactucae TaxID=4779 RepID=A0A976IC21_BRELC|nr:hypothetical protein CCR75_002729 [Bremia lactucae]